MLDPELDLRHRLPRGDHADDRRRAPTARRARSDRSFVPRKGSPRAGGRARARAGRRRPGRRRHLDRARPERARSARERAAPGAEDGSGRPPRHRHRARLQQPDHRAARLQRRADRGGAAGSARCARPAIEVRRAADRASALTQQLLAFSRRQVVGRAHRRSEPGRRAHGGPDPPADRRRDPARSSRCDRDLADDSAPMRSRSARC